MHGYSVFIKALSWFVKLKSAFVTLYQRLSVTFCPPFTFILRAAPQEHLGLTEHEYEVFLQEDVSISFEDLLNSQRRERHFRIYQLELRNDRILPFAFQGIEKLYAAGYDQPPASEYRLIYDGYFVAPVEQTDAEVLERIFECFNDTLPQGYHGRSVSMSDVIELYDENGRKYFYCDHVGFAPVRFSPMLAKRGE